MQQILISNLALEMTAGKFCQLQHKMAILEARLKLHEWAEKNIPHEEQEECFKINYEKIIEFLKELNMKDALI